MMAESSFLAPPWPLQPGRVRIVSRCLSTWSCFLFMLHSSSSQQSSLLSCWHSQRDCYPCSRSQAISLHHSGVVGKSDDVIGQICCSRGSAVFVMEACRSQSQGPTYAWRRVCSVCVCVGVLSRCSYQLLNHPSNYRSNQASITPSIIQGRQTERQNAARDVTDEWTDNKARVK